MRRLEELAAVNAGGNKSKMIRDLIDLAWQNPAGLGLFDPKRVALVAYRPITKSVLAQSPRT
jgi:hypothetical protein